MKLTSEKIIQELKKRKNVVAVYLFGSYAIGRMTPLSDIDICVIGNLTNREKMEIFFKFTKKFDVSFFSDLPIWIKARVFRDGKCLFVKNERTLNLIKLITLRNYLDFRPFIEQVVREELNV